MALLKPSEPWAMTADAAVRTAGLSNSRHPAMTDTPLRDIRERAEKLAAHIEGLDSASPDAKTIRGLLATIDTLAAQVAGMRQLLGEWRALDAGSWAVVRHAREKADLTERTNRLLDGDVRPPLCPYGDPTCPCPDGDACHYKAVGDTPAWDRPTPEQIREWHCAARKQSLPEPTDCDWPMCGCDPYADKVIAVLQEIGALSAAGQTASEGGGGE